jgi:unsaturated rhamnogalacturonyl hydrolase
MLRFKLFFLGCLLGFPIHMFSQTFADSVIKYGIEVLMPAEKYKWDWGQATMLHAVIQMHGTKPEDEKKVCFHYIKTAMDQTMPVANGKHPNAVASGIGMAFLARITGDSVYINKANQIYQDYLGIPRTKQGGVSHRTETVELWDDTIYMLGMFLLEMYRFTGDEKFLREFMEQYKIHKEKLVDKKWKLWVHGYDDDTINYPDRCCQANWADMTPARRSIEFWGRGNGWVVMAIADVLNAAPVSSEYYVYFAKELRQITSKLPGLQDPETGLWYQLPIYPNDKQNFLESSATAMFAYGMAIGLNHGVLKKRVYRPVVEWAYQGLKSHAMRAEGNYLIPTLVCEGTCIGDKNYYYGRKTKEGVNFAIGAYAMLGLEYERHVVLEQN